MTVVVRPKIGRSAAPELHLPVVRFILDSGVVLLVSERPEAPVTAAQLYVRGGHSLDPVGREGTAYLAGALADQGTERHGEEELAELLEPTGGHIGGDATGLTGTIAGAQWERLLSVMTELALTPIYPGEKFARHKNRLLHRLLVEKDEPRVQGERLFRRLVYGKHWLGTPVSGTLESVRAIERGDLVQFHRKNWVPNRSILAVCGPVKAQEIRRFLEDRLRGWKPGAPLGVLDDKLPVRAVRTGAFHAERQQVHVVLGHLGVRRKDPDYAALVVMDHVLGTGPGLNNRLSTKLREELGLAYTVTANIHGSAGELPGAFTAYIGTSPENVGTAIHGFVREMQRIQEELVPVDELATARNYLVGSFVLGFQRAARRVSFMITQERYQLSEDVLTTLPKEFAAVTAADVRRVARQHLYPHQCCVAAAGPIRPAELDTALTNTARRLPPRRKTSGAPDRRRRNARKRER